MAIAASDRHSGLGDAQFRSDDVHNSLVLVAEVEQGDLVFGCVALQMLEHDFRDRVQKRTIAADGRHDVIHRGEGALWEAHRKTALFNHRKRLWGRNFMDQMAADQDLILATWETSHSVLVPHGIKQGLATHIVFLRFEVDLLDCSVKEQVTLTWALRAQIYN